ncbi:MAG: hypothetical protein A2942_01030 [Candidatus Lloydbacteria bacterium RIFCSPLOWO2_01_FULL_50_20]|uniref:Uncharacterized protein n=1 Tax=Candidatus Lloydbacteria bacterium RIFCSPLOWO2_01_FULL_50_20 TaxID=1798665 RepID=A0A1G2DIE0_9BACT|nr:MAG: hypothetical protein A3C13_01385 [Candidatus Lloydbacteria bacterium RIFCSPHIGHO2_02_FULL_50_11]OGZ13415.1 MAG: hypothetical protein A2942_01030 [Candidatus Lloydbacteria bacterium RIFCSPLOWO2_01_FULL_50_20]
MEPNEQRKIDELLKLEKENNSMLRRMRRSMVWSQIFTAFYWLVILGALGWSYYYLQPYITQYWNAYQSAIKTLHEIGEQGKTLPANLQEVLDKVR